MIQATVENIYTTVTQLPRAPYDRKLFAYFKKKSPDAFWKARQTQGWSGATNFLSEKTNRLPTGLLHELKKWCKDLEFTLELDDKRAFPEPAYSKIDKDFLKSTSEEPFELRWYQVEAVNKALEEKRGLLKVSTGGGKTEIIAALAKAVGVKTLILVERVNLATQTKARLVKRGFKPSSIGIVGGGNDETDKPIVIATVQSSEKLEDVLLDFQMVLCDEVHHAKARTYVKLLKKLKNASYRIGLSGTLFTKDEEANWFRMAYLGAPIYEINTAELVEEKVLSKPIIRVIEITKPNNQVLLGCGNYNDAYVMGIVENHYRNSLITRLANKLPGKTLVLFQRIDHGQQLKQFIPRGIYVDGDDSPIIRDKKIAGFNAMSEGTMVASTIFDEGVDLPGIHNLIIGSGGKSIIKVIQRLGRGLRQNDTGMVQVFDFLDLTNSYLEKHSHERIGIYKTEGHTVKIIRMGED